MNGRLRSKGGNVLVSVLVAGFLIMALGLGILSRAVSDFDISRRSVDWESAFYLAWAGVEHSLGILNARFQDYANKPSGEVVLVVPETPLGNGTYEVSVVSLGSGRYQAHSVGRSRSSTRRIAATLAFRNATAAYYHLWGAENYKISGNSIIEGDLYAADTIDLGGWTEVRPAPDGTGGNVVARNMVNLDGNVTVRGDVISQTVSIKSNTVKVLGSIYTGFGPQVAMPEITLSGIRAMRPEQLNPADHTSPFTLDCTPLVNRHPACDGGYYLHGGDLTVYGQFKGRTVIGVESDPAGGPRRTDIPRDLLKARNPVTGELVDPTTLVALVSDGPNSSLTVFGGRTVEALLYSRDKHVDLPGNVTVVGAVIAQKVDNNGNLFFRADPLMADMLPGLPGVRLVVIEWHEE